jgi:hypothetical protein
MLVRRILKELGAETYIRRFRNVSGHTMMSSRDECVAVNFQGRTEKLGTFTTLLSFTAVEIVSQEETFFIDVFTGLALQLHDCDYVENVPESSPSSNGGIITRFYTRSMRAKSEAEVHQEVLDLADE